MAYQPFKYPPDLELARLHSECSQPGSYNPEGRVCPCCGIQEKKPVKDWLTRDIKKDFGQYGGAVVSYFSILKYYIFACLIVIVMYSVFETYCIYMACNQQHMEDIDPADHPCVKPKPMWVWVVSTDDLVEFMRRLEMGTELTLLLILRGFTFIFLVLANLFSLYVVSRERNRKKNVAGVQTPGIHHYTLFFKNINKEWTESDLKEAIKRVDPENVEIKEIFFLSQTDEYKRLYDQKIESYFKLKHLKKEKEIKKEQVKLEEAVRELANRGDKMLTHKTGRAIVTFNTIQQQRIVKKHFSPSFLEKIQQALNIFTNDKMYADQMPRPEELFWQYMGKESSQKIKMKVITFFMMIAFLGVSFVILWRGLDFANQNDKQDLPATQKVISTVMALVLVAMALIYRQFINKLAEMRHPNTQTSKTMFIVCGTVIFHFIYYLIIPTFFFVESVDKARSMKLYSISYQALNFLVVQIILAGCDIFYCCWDRNRTKLLASEGAGMCQKQLHTVLTAPRFPLEFKLIIMFKAWSFVVFYAFEVPYIMLFICGILIFVFINDKKNVYNHYRMETIGYRVQRSFLIIYTNFFTVYLCLFFCLTQRLTFELEVALVVSTLAIIAQILFSVWDKRSSEKMSTVQSSILYQQLNPENTYRQEYEKYLKSLSNPDFDDEVKQSLERTERKGSVLVVGESISDRLLS